MDKRKLIALSAGKTDYAKWEIAKILPEIFDTILEGVARNEKVHIGNFGTFQLKVKKGRRSRSTANKEPIVYPPKVSVTFTVHPKFKIDGELLERLLEEKESNE